MPKDQVICPKETRKAGEITFKPVPVMQYESDYKAEEKKYGKDRLVKGIAVVWLAEAAAPGEIGGFEVVILDDVDRAHAAVAPVFRAELLQAATPLRPLSQECAAVVLERVPVEVEPELGSRAL